MCAPALTFLQTENPDTGAIGQVRPGHEPMRRLRVGRGRNYGGAHIRPSHVTALGAARGWRSSAPPFCPRPNSGQACAQIILNYRAKARRGDGS
ncbi:Pectinesterase 5 [Clarias magur]|uniref:Pectinesterase 5 n=1 Tax=Clarias magur TaxID=1594786 RepID=A0A8J4TNC5_CLAMG|nr:Pectinesterase 5 [Clarias magur]